MLQFLRTLVPIVVDEVVGVVDFEPLKEVEGGQSEGPVENDFHLPDEGTQSVGFEQHILDQGYVFRELWLVGFLWVAVTDLEPREDEVGHPKQVDPHQGARLTHEPVG